MRILSINTQQFSMLVSVYTLSAAISCFIASTVMDRFDRKRVLIGIYSGLVLGTFLCGFARSYEVLLAARVITGLFGGLLQAIILSIIGDVVPENHRGKATGIVMAAFAVSSVAGVPIGLAIANNFSWYATFFSIGIFSLINLLLAWYRLPAMNTHMQRSSTISLSREFGNLLTHRSTWLAWLLIISMMSIFALFPFISPFLIQILGFSESNLPEIYLAQGIATIICAPYIGKLSDRFGSKKIFIICSGLSIGTVLIFTHLETASLALVIALNTIMAAVGIGRMAPSMDMINRSVGSEQRGSFNTLVAAVQQLAASGASYLGGMLLSGTKGMGNFGAVGSLVAGSMVISIGISAFFKSHNNAHHHA